MNTRTPRRPASAVLASTVAVVGLLLVPSSAWAQNCASTNPADWPPPARPYFMIAFDTSGSMGSDVGTMDNSCGYAPLRDRVSHGRCAVWNTILAFAGLANFGLATFPRTYECSGSCYSSCSLGGSSCGSGSGTSRAGALIRVPIEPDRSGQTSNVSQLLTWVDGVCNGQDELFASGMTPLNGILRDMYRYYSNQWVAPGGGTTYVSPLGPTSGGEMDCRSVNVILITDGGETCDSASEAIDAAHDLYTGFAKDGITWHVRTYVIDFGGGGGSTADHIADRGDDGLLNSSTNAFYAADEVGLSQAFATIITQAIQPEVCDNTDNNCNGCVDEGFFKYCNTRSTCCSWSNPSQRNNCLAAYEASIATNPPDGNLDLLPCTTSAQQQQPDTWLCYNPGEDCDYQDNNCDGQVDEDVQLNACGTCGTLSEIPCNGIDDDCDPTTLDEPAGCLCGTEFCDGVDNDCDGLVDQDDPDFTNNPVPCGPNPPLGICEQGILECDYGATDCIGAVYPEPETCDGRDENCNGIVDDVVYDPPECVIPNCQSACCDGHWECQNGVDVCVPNAITANEECNGVDDDCDGRIDEGAQCEQPLVCWFGDCAFRVPPDGCGGAGLTERDGLCVADPCRGTLCEGGLVCEPATGDCIDPCAVFTCTDPAELCDVTQVTCDASGTCTADDTACVTPNCYLDPTLCLDGEVCVDGSCEPDPCFGSGAIDCGADACRDATCIATCAGVECDVGRHCVDGVCVTEPCGTFTCPPGQTCVDGQCAQDPCGGVTCKAGQVCKDGQCTDDPCRLIVCPADTVCREGQCVGTDPDGGVIQPDAGPGADAGPFSDAGDATNVDGGAPDEFRITAGGGGCACHTAAGPGSGAGGSGGAGLPGLPGGAVLSLLLLALLGARRRRRLRHPHSHNRDR